MKIQLSPQSLRRRERRWASVLCAADGVAFARARGGVEQPAVDQPGRVPHVADLPAHVDPREFRVVTSVAAADVLCWTMQLPTTNPAELKQMLDLQLDQLTPLPPEEVVYDFEALEVHDGHTRVLVALARRSAVDERVTALENAGYTTEVVGVAPLAILRELVTRTVLPRDDRLGLLVSLEPGAVVVILYANGLPLTLRTILLGSGGLLTPEAQSAVREDLQRTLLAEQTTRPRQPGAITFLAATEDLRAVARDLSQGWEPAAVCLDNGSAPAFATSLCWEQASATQRRLNLLPEDWRRRRRAAHRRRFWGRIATVVGGVYLLVAIAFLIALGIRQASWRRLTAEKTALEAEFQQARQLQGELTAMRLQLETQTSALDVLAQISSVLPPNVKLNLYSYHRNDAVTLRGQADNAQAVLDFIGRLDNVPVFTAVKTISMPTERAGSLTKFELLATLDGRGARPAGGGAWR